MRPFTEDLTTPAESGQVLQHTDHPRGRPESGAELQQKDHLCGPFHVARVLRDWGVTQYRGEPLDQDLVALCADTALPSEGLAFAVPPRAASRCDYRYELRKVDADAAGTSARGLASAIEELAGGRIACVPLMGAWSAGTVEALLKGVADLDVRLVANLRTGLLWASRPSPAALLAALDGAVIVDPPRADWDVGHFVELVQLLRGRRGSLVLVRDSYPTLGWAGMHLQPPGAVAAAMARGDGLQGGVLALVRSDAAHVVKRLATALGLRTEIWDNENRRAE